MLSQITILSSLKFLIFILFFYSIKLSDKIVKLSTSYEKSGLANLESLQFDSVMHDEILKCRISKSRSRQRLRSYFKKDMNIERCIRKNVDSLFLEEVFHFNKKTYSKFVEKNPSHRDLEILIDGMYYMDGRLEEFFVDFDISQSVVLNP